MADNILKLKVDSSEYEGKIKRAAQGIQALGQNLRNAGKTFADADKDAVEFTRELGKMQTVSTSARGKVNELSAAFVNLKSDYMQMSEAEKRSPIGQAMAKSLDELKNRTISAKNELESLKKELDDIKKPEVGSIAGNEGGGLFSGDKISGMLQVFGGNMMTKAAGWAAGFVSEIGDAVKQGIELAKAGEGIRLAFERLGRGDILDGLREATHGTVTDIELMKAAVKFNDFKLPLDQLGTMLAFAQQKAKDTGQSVDYMVESITNGLGRQSKPILDNLGISAKEIEERMKSTGDFTKAVGEIIRDQMKAAGDYVETAADRAAQANVNLQNKMEELGRKFAPIEEASSQLWTSMKIGILDIIGGPLATLLNQLTEAGRLKNQLNNMNGGGMMERFGNNLRNSKDPSTLYSRQLAAINRSINAAEAKLQQAEKGGMGSIQIYRERVQALKEVKKQYEDLYKTISRPVDNPLIASDTDKKKPKKGGGKTEVVYAEGSIAAQAKLVSDLQKKWNEAGEDMRTGYLYQLIEAENKLKSMKDEQKALRDMTTWGDLKGAPVTGLGESSFSGKSLKDLQGVKLELKLPKEKTEASLTKEVGNMAGGISQMVGSMEALGIELPEGMKNVVNGVTSLISIVSGIATIVTAIEALTAADTVIPFARGGVVRAAGGYVVPGNYNSGDMVHAALTSGEVVLNRAQVGNLASQLQESGGGGGGVQVARISGEQIYVALNRYLKRSGQGELATWG